MIFFISDGRLGNQLFQYSFLKSICKNNEKIVVFNMEQLVSNFDIDYSRFKSFKLKLKYLLVLNKIIKPTVIRLLWKVRLIDYIKQVTTEYQFCNKIFHSKGVLPITFVETDYFQSDQFFDQSKIDFKIKIQYVSEAKIYLSQIPDEFEKVFVHLRRGDYLYTSYKNNVGIELPKKYFQKAITEITKHVKNPFYVFLSDDPEFVKYCFENVKNKIISKNNLIVDMAIMSLCNYGIGSNSSFSWWGAFLMSKKNMVIFPNYWYGWKIKELSHHGIFPKWAMALDFEDLENVSTGNS